MQLLGIDALQPAGRGVLRERLTHRPHPRQRRLALRGHIGRRGGARVGVHFLLAALVLAGSE
ncbi:MAG TPA: hypothetical protein VGS96_03125, partial [Thermoanaerobaculia bacterium]|nr:hypothetical protein [Thermoanaerobaculia bacterium]